MNNAEFSPSRRAWNRFFTAAVWVAAALVIVLVAGIIAMVLARGIPHILSLIHISEPTRRTPISYAVFCLKKKKHKKKKKIFLVVC